MPLKTKVHRQVAVGSGLLGVNPGDSIAPLTDIEEEAFPLLQNVLLNVQLGCGLGALTATKGQDFFSCALRLILVECICAGNGRVVSFGSVLAGIGPAAELLRDAHRVGPARTNHNDASNSANHGIRCPFGKVRPRPILSAIDPYVWPDSFWPILASATEPVACAAVRGDQPIIHKCPWQALRQSRGR